ncbi:replication initiator protein [Capybara microvirus Cap3_SP_646]|nr:replication initiator protein [Capybara microvirus Cap3_SP_646]
MACRNYAIFHSDRGYFYAPCGQCMECRLKDLRDWYVRSRFEAKCKERPFHYFLTLTYDDENLPVDGFASRDDIKAFFKSLRHRFEGASIRYFATSDYGGKLGRAHFHAIVFSSVRIFANSIFNVWQKGFTKLKVLTPVSMRYCCKYTIKKRDLVGSEGYVNPRAFFRLVSKHYGENGINYFNGTDNFVEFDGKKFGWPQYLIDKIVQNGLDPHLVFDKEATKFYKTYREASYACLSFVKQNNLRQLSGDDLYNEWNGGLRRA